MGGLGSLVVRVGEGFRAGGRWRGVCGGKEAVCLVAVCNLVVGFVI